MPTMHRNERRKYCTFDIHGLKRKQIQHIITHLESQMYVWHGYEWNFAGPQIYLQLAKAESQHFGVSLKFLLCN